VRRLALAVVLSSCGAPGDGASLELGVGETSFVPVAEGAEVELVMGLQGGWHVPISTRVEGLDPSAITLEVRAVRPTDGRVLCNLPLRLTVDSWTRDGERLVRWGDRAILDIGSPAEVAPGDLELSLRATDSTGAVLEDHRTITLVDRVDEIP
jgi:hypothetical protein